MSLRGNHAIEVRKMKKFWLINLALFQASWFSAALLTHYATVIIAGLVIVHFLLSPSPRSDCKLLLLVIIGMSADSLHLWLGTFSVNDTLFPIWLMLLWAMFSMSFNHSLIWFTKQPYWLLAVFGASGGSLSYWGGIQTGAFSTNLSPTITIGILALSWSLLFPFLIIGYRYLISPNVQSLR